MTIEVKLIYSSMLTTKEYGSRVVPKYAEDVVEKHIDILDNSLSEFENIQLLLLKVIKDNDRACESHIYSNAT